MAWGKYYTHKRRSTHYFEWILPKSMICSTFFSTIFLNLVLWWKILFKTLHWYFFCLRLDKIRWNNFVRLGAKIFRLQFSQTRWRFGTILTRTDAKSIWRCCFRLESRWNFWHHWDWLGSAYHWTNKISRVQACLGSIICTQIMAFSDNKVLITRKSIAFSILIP